MAMSHKVAVVQASPVVFDRERTLEKLRRFPRSCATGSTRLVLSEAFVSAYPRGLDLERWSVRAGCGRRFPPVLGEQRVPGPAVDHLSHRASNHLSRS
jgi:nitrilase